MGLSKADFENIAGYVTRTFGVGDIALLPDKVGGDMPDHVYCVQLTPAPGAPRSSIVDMIQMMNERSAPYYRLLETSSTIYYTGLTNVMDDSMATMNKVKLTKIGKKNGELKIDPSKLVQLTSQRWAQGVGLQPFAVGVAGPNPNVGLALGKREKHLRGIDRLYMMTAYSLLTARFVKDQLGGEYGNVGALLVRQDGAVIGLGLNTKDENSTYHAEVNLIQSAYYLGVNIPAHTRLYTTLKPCRMCAGMIAHATGNQTTVIYGQDDQGKDATKTPLDSAGNSFLLDGASFKAKPIQIGTGNEKLPMPPLMAELRKSYDGKGGIIEALGSEASTATMLDATATLERKFQKYDPIERLTNPKRLKYDTRMVVEHLQPFLLGKGATLGQIIRKFQEDHGAL